MTFFGRGVLLEYHLPVFELRSQRNSNPRNATLAPGSVIVTRRVFSALSDTPMASASSRLHSSARSAHCRPFGVSAASTTMSSRYRAFHSSQSPHLRFRLNTATLVTSASPACRAYPATARNEPLLAARPRSSRSSRSGSDSFPLAILMAFLW
jgi:hypothetical protein